MDTDSARSAPQPNIKKINPLLRFSLQGEAAALDEIAVAHTPLLGSFCLSGQGTVLCAPPNAGKTLITIALLIEAIEQERIDGAQVFYVDADDTVQGVAEKVRLLDEYGVHVVAEGHHGFRSSLLAPSLETMIADGTAHGMLVILDTFKKFAQLMSKTETARFTDVARRFIQAGGALLCLAHTNKHPDSKGKNIFAGVSDIVDDMDSAYIIDVSEGRDGKRIAQLTNRKRRGNSPDVVSYAYSPDPALGYVERITSVHETDAFDGGDDTSFDHKTRDVDILHALSLSIHHRPELGKMALVRAVAELEQVSKRRVLKLLEEHTGDDPEHYRWRYVVKAHGLHAYELTGPLPEPPA